MFSHQALIIPFDSPQGASVNAALVAADPAMLASVARAESAASSDATVLITGESGVGKTMMAAHLHRISPRCAGPIASLDCEGFAAPAWTDGSGAGIGGLALADCGTLLLDEVGGMGPRTQAMLVRLLADRDLGRVPFDIRLVATTNRDLQHEVRLGRFSADLYFRLNVVTVKVPPLRDRPLDIAALAAIFAQRFAVASGRPAMEISPAAQARLGRHSWPGNVRELANVIQRAVLAEAGPRVTEASVDIDHFDDAAESGAGGVPVQRSIGGLGPAVPTEGRTIEAVERDMILAALCSCKANRSQAALVLGISTRTLRNKLRAYKQDGVRIPRPVVVAVA